MRSGTTSSDRPTPDRRPVAGAVLALGLVLLAAAAGSLPPRAGAEAPPAAGPAELPALRRVLLTADQVAAALDRSRQGVLRSLPRAEFEEKVDRAARAVEAARHPPKLAEARYRARLGDAALVGTGQWKVAYAGPGPGLLPLQPLSIALRQPRFENRDALIADFDGKAPSLLLQESGDHSVAIEWSARGDERPEGLHFDLKLPASPVAVLELDLPADRVAATADGSLLSGPHAAEAPDRRLWRVGCGGRPGVDLWVRRAGPAAQPTLLLARQVTTQTLTPEGLDATYRFELEVQHREVGELLLECDPGLRPLDVAIPGLDSREIRPPAGPGAPTLLSIRLREPLRHGRETLVVRCLAPAGSPRTPPEGAPEPPTVEWRSPGIRIAGAVPRGEALEIVIDPQLRLAGLEPGDFRLAASSEETDPDRPGVTRRLSFSGGALAGPDGPPRRPSARLQPHAVEYRARQFAWWQPTADPPSLTLQIGYEVEYGRLFQLPVLLPPGWDVERVELSPAGLLRNWGVRPAPPGGDEGRQTLLVELARPLVAGVREREASGVGALFGRVRVPTLTARLVRKGPAEGFGSPTPLPDAVPLGARLREGVLGVSYDSQTYQATFRSAAVEADREDEGPWGRQVPDAIYQYRGRPVEGTLLLRPLPPRVRVHCVSDVSLAAGRAAVTTRLILEAESGRPDAIDLSLSASPPARAGAGHAAEGQDGWEWRIESGDSAAKKDNAVKRFEHSHAAEAAEAVGVFGGGNPVGTAAALTALEGLPPREHWRLTLARPLRPRETLVLRADRRLEGRNGRWEVPLPAVTGAARMDGEVTLHLEGADFVDVQPRGLQEATPPPAAPGRSRVGTPWRTFRYGDNSVSLTLGVSGASVDRRTAEAVADQARLTTYLGGDGAARHQFSFRVANWARDTLPLRMPPGARLVAARVGGHPVALPSALPPSAEAGVLELPAPRVPGAGSGDAALRYEIVYDTDPPAADAWRLWSTVEAPAPVLPVPALTFRRTWRLPPGVDPVPDGRQRRLPGPGGDVADGLPRGLSERFLLSTPLPEALTPHPAAGEQAEALAAAAAGLRPKAGRQLFRLRQLVAEMTAGFLGGRLVVDDAALREAGVSGESYLTLEPFDGTGDQNRPWEALGLAAVGAGPAPLLTTLARTRQWARPDDPPDRVKEAVAEALANGHDASGHYRTAPDWIRHGAERGRELGESLPDFGPALTPWTEWEPLAGAADDSSLVVVRRDRVLAAGVLLAAVLCVVLWVIRWRAQMLLAWLALAGLGVLWLPSALQPLAWFPLLAGVAAALVGYFVAVKRQSGRARSPGRGSIRPVPAAAVPAALAVLLAAVGATGTADAPAPATVYLIPDRAGGGGKETVLAPPDLLDRLDALAQAGLSGAGPVVLAASYKGQANGTVAAFDATFEAYCPGERPALLNLPLDGVYLEGDVLVDGARALPTASQAGYALPLRGAGRHTVELRFRVAVTEEGGGRAVHFGAPRATQSHLHLALPPGSSHAEALVKHGEQTVTAGTGGTVLEAELGRVTAPLHVRWTQDSRPGAVSVREAYLWELDADAATLTGCLDYRVANGVVDTLTVDVPPGLEVQAAEARRVGLSDPVRLRDWRVTGPGPTRSLELDLAAPATGRFLVVLTLVPTSPLAAEVTLPLPAPRGHVSAERSHVAYRARGVAAARVNIRWLTGGPAEAFAPFWPGPTRPDLRNTGGEESVYAATFRREGNEGPVLRVRLAAAPPRLVVQRQDVTVRVAARHAEVEASLRVAAPDGDPAAISCLLRPPGMTVSSVRGPGVRRWTQTGDTLAVWMKGNPAADRRVATTVEVSAWHPFDAGRGPLVIPSLRVEGATRGEPATVRIVPEAGLTLTPVSTDGLRPVASPEPELGFVANRPDYSGTCEVRPGAAGAAVRILTVAGVRDQRLTFRSTVEFAVERGELRAASVQLRNWDGEDVKLEVEKEVPVRQRRRAADRTWSLELPPGVKGRFRLSLSGSVPLEDAAAGVPMPEVSVPGSATALALVEVEGTDLSAEGAEGLTPAEVPAAALKDWPGEADRFRLTGGQVWKADRDRWRLRLRPRGGAGAGPARLLLADHTAVVADGRHWLHETLYWVQHGANTDLNVILPKPGTVMSVAVDGVDVAPLQPERRRLWLPLPARAGVRAVRIRWRYDSQAEPLGQPLLQTPSVEGAVAGPALWTIYLPAGFEAVPGPSPELLPGPARAAAVALYRAEAQLRVSAALAEASRGGTPAALASAQQRFYAACRQAEQDLQLTNARNATGPSGESLSQRLHSLLDENRKLAREYAFEETRAEAERRADAAGALPRPAPEEGDTAALAQPGPARLRGPLPDSGTPYYLGLADPQVVPELVLRTREVRKTRELFADSAAWLGLLMLAGLVAFLPGLSARLRPFWPEPLLLLGVIAWYRSGLTAVAVLFLLLGVAGRLVATADGVRGLLRKRRPAPVPSTLSGVRGSSS